MSIFVFCFVFRSDPRNPPNWPGKAAPDPPDIVEQPQRKLQMFEAGVGDQLATLRVSRAKR